MQRRHFLRLAGGTLAAAATPTQTVAPRRPNVLFILADDLGYGGLHCYGTDFVETPNIDRLCAESMKFTNGYAAYPTCRPSRAALLTGQYGPRTGVYRVCDHYGDEDKARFIIPENHQLDPHKITLGKLFKQAGYTTAMYGKWHVSNPRKSHPKDDFGFDVAYVSHGAHYHAESLPPVELPEGMMIEERFTEMAAGFMEQAVRANKPFFLFMPYFLVHAPFEAPPEEVTAFRRKLKDRTDLKPPPSSRKRKNPRDLATVLAMTRILDTCVGRLLDKLKELGVEQDTIVLFTSDNGSYDSNLVGGYRGRKGDVYDGGMRVPYLFKWPGRIRPGSVCTERIIGVDVYPTLAALAGIPLPPPNRHPVDGVDLSPLLFGKTDRLPPRPLYCFYPKYARYHHGKWGVSWRNMIVDSGYKLIEYPEYDRYELFDLTRDPKETRNLADLLPEKRRALTRKLHRWLETIHAPELRPNPDYRPSTP